MLQLTWPEEAYTLLSDDEVRAAVSRVLELVFARSMICWPYGMHTAAPTIQLQEAIILTLFGRNLKPQTLSTNPKRKAPTPTPSARRPPPRCAT